MKYFTPTHEWCDVTTHHVGLSEFAKKELGEIVYVSLPLLQTEVKAGDELCILESTKAAADLYAPYDGIVTAVNPEAITYINQDPEGKGWLVVITPVVSINADSFLKTEDYQILVRGLE